MYVMDKRSMQMAKELARELIHVQQKKETMNEFETIRETFEVMYNQVKDAVIDIWEEIKSAFKLTEIDERHKRNWHVPLDTSKLSQITLPNIHIPNIRNGI